MPDINYYSPRSGRQVKENGVYVNTAELIEAIHQAIVINRLKVDLEGTSINATIDTSSTMRTPTVGAKTVTSMTAEIFAGSSRLIGRRKMMIKNESPDVRIRIGSVSVATDRGFPIEPGAVVHMDFNPAVDVPIYAASEAGKIQVEVMEI